MPLPRWLQRGGIAAGEGNQSLYEQNRAAEQRRQQNGESNRTRRQQDPAPREQPRETEAERYARLKREREARERDAAARRRREREGGTTSDERLKNVGVEKPVGPTETFDRESTDKALKETLSDANLKQVFYPKHLIDAVRKPFA